VSATTVNSHFALSVADTGPGIPEHERTRIFEPFHQIDNSNTKGSRHCQADRRDARRSHLGRVDFGQGLEFRTELPVRAAAAAGTA
jgi:signal transduction histidine kinase